MFIKDVAAELAAAEAAGTRPDLSVLRQIRKGEEIVYTLSDPGMLAFAVLYTTAVKMALDVSPENLQTDAEREGVKRQLAIAGARTRLFWDEIRLVIPSSVVAEK